MQGLRNSPSTLPHQASCCCCWVRDLALYLNPCIVGVHCELANKHNNCNGIVPGTSIAQKRGFVLTKVFLLKFCSKVRTNKQPNNQASLPVGNSRTIYPTGCALGDGWVPPRAWCWAIVCLLGQHWAGGVAASSDGGVVGWLIGRAAGRIVLNILCEIL